jgi:hypothetical protein
MRMSLRERVLAALALGTAAAVLTAAVELAFGKPTVPIPATVHFFAVGMTALGAAIGARLSDTRTVLIGTADHPERVDSRGRLRHRLRRPLRARV